MTLHKKVASKDIEALNDTVHFPKGAKYIYDNDIWTVVSVEFEDNTPMRKVASSGQGMEVLELRSLMRDLQSGQIVMMKDAAAQDQTEEQQDEPKTD